MKKRKLKTKKMIKAFVFITYLMYNQLYVRLKPYMIMMMMGQSSWKNNSVLLEVGFVFVDCYYNNKHLQSNDLFENK